ncbi:MAG: hypothetical protein IJX63_07215 [Lachnospiraceae bacterium]|nr:hypothetical protein [Lachnospiraceae bacterium]
MGLDIYAGSFVRYYTRNWKTAAQQFCEENGLQYSQISAQERDLEEEKASVEEIEQTVNMWQNQLVSALQNSGIQAAKTWLEDNETPYYTNKPDWDALGALLLYAAGKLMRQRYPEKYRKNTKYHEVLEIMGVSKSPYHNWSLFSNVCHYIPIEDGFVFKYPLVNGTEAMIGTTKCLKYELTKINELGWKADEETILSWAETEGYPAEATVASGKMMLLQMFQRHEYHTESLAKFAFSILWQAVTFAEKERVAIIFDY